MSDDHKSISSVLGDAQRLIESGEVVAAFKVLQDVHKVAPTNLAVLSKMGEILVKNGQIDDAIRIYDHVLMLAPEDVETRITLVSLLHKKGLHQRVLTHANFLIEKDPGNPHWYTMPAYICHSVGDLKNARYYIDLGTRNASHGIDFQSGKRHSLPDEARAERDRAAEKNAKAFTRGLLRRGPALATWSAVVEDDGRVGLRGASRGLAGTWRVKFEIVGFDKENAFSLATEATGRRARGIRQWWGTVDKLEAGKTYACRLTATKGKRVIDGGVKKFSMPCHGPPVAETGPATPLGTDGATVNGTVGGSHLPTRYWFAWGATADRLTNKTPSRFLPPGRTLRVRDALYHGPRNWLLYSLESLLQPYPGKHADDDAPDFLLRLFTPFGKDRNHLSGVGVAELVCGWDCTAQPRSDLGIRHAGDFLDFRDAEVEFTVDFSNLDAKDYLLSFWLHTYIGTSTAAISTAGQSAHLAAPWGLTGQLVDTAGLVGPAMHTIRFSLPCRSDAWTYAGNNVPEQGAWAGRYTYHPLHDTLADHRGNMVLIFLFGHERELPEGSFDIATATLRCRNHSLLAPGMPARLVAWPATAFTDPGVLTNGRIGDRDHFWCSEPKPRKPQDFVWDLGLETSVEFLRIRQNPLFPARRIEVWGANDKKFTRLWKTELSPEVPTGTKDDPTASRILPRPAMVRLLKLRIISGYKDAFWGLDAIEVFGQGADPRPEREPCTLCEDLTGLEPGQTVYYQLVAENRAGNHKGMVCSFVIPPDRIPIIHSAHVFRHRLGKTMILVRMTAMGEPTTLVGRATDDAGNTLDCPPRDAGNEQTPRHITCNVAGVMPGGRYRLELTAENVAGRSAPVTVVWETPA